MKNAGIRKTTISRNSLGLSDHGEYEEPGFFGRDFSPEASRRRGYTLGEKLEHIVIRPGKSPIYLVQNVVQINQFFLNDFVPGSGVKGVRLKNNLKFILKILG